MKFNKSMVKFVKFRNEINGESHYGYEKTAVESIFYANFLSQELEIWMFVPAVFKDGKWVVLEKPKNYDVWLGLHESSGSTIGFTEHEEYRTALSKVIFEGFELDYDTIVKNVNNRIWFKDKEVFIDNSKNKITTIEDLIPYNLDIKESIAKELGLI